MHKSEMSIYKAIVSEYNQSTMSVYVLIPHVLGPTTSVALSRPTVSNYGWTWEPSIGDQVIVAVEGAEFDKVYLLNII